jgi:peptidoglycan hydrolase CwlO-like protein
MLPMTEARLREIEAALQSARPSMDLVHDQEAWARDHGQSLIDALRAAWRERDEARNELKQLHRETFGIIAEAADSHASLKAEVERLTKERDEARAERKHLKIILRQPRSDA